MNYKLWLFKNKRKDELESWTDYYLQTYGNSESWKKSPQWLKDATIKEGFKTRFVIHLDEAHGMK